jgi:hypothetical protein
MSNGTAVFSQLPAGRYNVQTSGGIVPASATVNLDHSSELQVRVLGTVDTAAIAAIVIVSVASAVLSVRWRRTHPKGMKGEEGEAEQMEEEKPPPPPPPPEEESAGSLRDFYERTRS